MGATSPDAPAMTAPVDETINLAAPAVRTVDTTPAAPVARTSGSG